MTESIIASGDARPIPPTRALLAPDSLALQQVSAILNEIATLATDVDEAFYHLDLDAGKAHDLGLRLIRGVVQRLGWLADLGTDKLRDSGVAGYRVNGDAEHWLLHPAYNDLAANAQGDAQ